MRSAQQLLFPDSQPLVERLGRDFFRLLPESPGVYLMRDATDTVLYVGKAKNLRRRLGSYRTANPDRMPRRHLRMLRAVVRIELQECADETSALLTESNLLRTLRPKFNRAGTWQAPPRFLAWQSVAQRLHFKVVETPAPRWRTFGPLRAGARMMRAILARLLWFALHPKLSVVDLPVGWFDGNLEAETVIDCQDKVELALSNLEKLGVGQVEEFLNWIREQLPTGLHSFDKAVIERDLELAADALRGFGKRPLYLRESEPAAGQ